MVSGTFLVSGIIFIRWPEFFWVVGNVSLVGFFWVGVRVLVFMLQGLKGEGSGI